jgi:phage shock protein E
MQWLTIFLVAFVVIFLFLPKLQAVSAEEGGRLLRGGAKLIDVRTEGEFRQASVPGSINYPLNELESLVSSAGLNKEDPILVFCRSGNRSAKAKRLLIKLGYTSVENLGGFDNAVKAAKLSQQTGE